MRHNEFFALARERYNIFLKRQAGEPRPWTTDEYLRQFKFCNVFREDDRTTVWIRENIRDPLRDSPKVFQAMLIARWFNRIETLEHIKDVLLEDRWVSEEQRPILEKISPLITAAYMIRTPPGMDKLTGLLWNIDQALPAVREKAEQMAKTTDRNTIRDATSWLSGFPNLGQFLAYEVITDLRHTFLLENAPDIMTWANPGPGCERGIEHLMERPVRDEGTMIDIMRQLVELSQDPANWPADWPSWEIRDAEHMLCEFDKYERVRTGAGTPKQRYDGGGPKTISYGLGKARPAPRAAADPLAAIIEMKLGPQRKELAAARLRVDEILMEKVVNAFDISGVPVEWLPIVDSAIVELAGQQIEIRVTPPRRLPSIIAETGVTVDSPEALEVLKEVRSLEEKLVARESALREALENL